MLMRFPHTRVVVWSDPENGLKALRQKLADLGLEVHPVASLEEARAVIGNETVHLLMSWLGEAAQKQFELVDWLRSQPVAPPLVLVTTGGDVDLYLEAMRRGAFDCVGLPLDSQELTRIVTRALESCCAHSAGTGG